ncbi:MAG: hypothetical protein ABFS56_04915 [Pseudomonadota bacterium]
MTPSLPSEDAAWVRIATPLSVKSLREFCRDLERLYRINPLLELIEWRKIGPNQYYLGANNLSNSQKIATEIYREESDEGFKFSYSKGLKSATFIRIEKEIQGSALILIDDYSGLSEAERTQRLAEVDRSLEHWGRELFRYLQNWQRWHWFPPYRWYMRRVWQPMKPSARRIAYMLIIVSLFELLAFFVIAGIWIL